MRVVHMKDGSVYVAAMPGYTIRVLRIGEGSMLPSNYSDGTESGLLLEEFSMKDSKGVEYVSHS